MIRHALASDTSDILGILQSSGQFDADGVALVTSRLRQHFDERDGSYWLVAVEDGLAGVAYCIPEPVTSGTWNLLMLWIRADRLSRGHGAALVDRLEQELVRIGARLLIVETSGTPDFAPARKFYARRGFAHEATIRDFYAEGDDKLVLTKRLTGRAAS